MIIACPNCSTRYSLDPGTVGSTGKSVRCSNCGHLWFQEPLRQPATQIAFAHARAPSHARVAPVMAQPATPSPVGAPAYAFGAPIAPYQHPVQTPPPYPPTPPVPPIPSQLQEAVTPHPEPSAAAMSEPVPEPEPLLAAKVESEPEPQPTAEPEEEDDPDTGALSQEQLDEMFGDDQDFAPVQSLAAVEADDDLSDVTDPEQLPDPDPIPQSLTSPEDGLPRERKGGALKIVLMAMPALLVAIGGGLYFARGLVVDLWPAAAAYYGMVGLSVDSLGRGLTFRDSRSDYEVEGEIDVLVVSGVIANVSESPKSVPNIRVALFDADGNDIQSVVVPPRKATLKKGDVMGYRARIKEPSPLARGAQATWTEEVPTPDG